MAEGVRRDVDAARGESISLHRGERSIVPDDLRDRIVHWTSGLLSCRSLPAAGYCRVISQTRHTRCQSHPGCSSHDQEPPNCVRADRPVAWLRGIRRPRQHDRTAGWRPRNARAAGTSRSGPRLARRSPRPSRRSAPAPPPSCWPIRRSSAPAWVSSPAERSRTRPRWLRLRRWLRRGLLVDPARLDDGRLAVAVLPARLEAEGVPLPHQVEDDLVAGRGRLDRLDAGLGHRHRQHGHDRPQARAAAPCSSPRSLADVAGQQRIGMSPGRARELPAHPSAHHLRYILNVDAQAHHLDRLLPALQLERLSRQRRIQAGLRRPPRPTRGSRPPRHGQRGER